MGVTGGNVGVSLFVMNVVVVGLTVSYVSGSQHPQIQASSGLSPPLWNQDGGTKLSLGGVLPLRDDLEPQASSGSGYGWTNYNNGWGDEFDSGNGWGEKPDHGSGGGYGWRPKKTTHHYHYHHRKRGFPYLLTGIAAGSGAVLGASLAARIIPIGALGFGRK